MRFQYLEVRPCIDIGGNVVSYTDEEEFHSKVAELSAAKLRRPLRFKTFWTLYGRHDAGGIFAATAIGDFPSKQSAHEIMNAILAPMAAARDKIQNNIDEERDNGSVITAAERAACDLDDFINQSSNMERI